MCCRLYSLGISFWDAKGEALQSICYKMGQESGELANHSTATNLHTCGLTVSCLHVLSPFQSAGHGKPEPSS